MAEPAAGRKGPGSRESDRVVCPHCLYLLPVSVAEGECAVCGLAELDRLEERCHCLTPVWLRLYFGRHLCLCGQLEAVAEVV
jgi:hypothetical protein